MNLIVRTMQPEDEPFVLGAWLHGSSERRTARLWAVEELDREQFWRLERRRVEFLVSACETICAIRDDSVISGWACFDRGVIHELYVRHLDRRQGVGKILLAEVERRWAT